MTPAVVLGDHGGGTSTFLGLLYAALVRRGTDEHDGLRVHASYESLRAIKDVYVSLVDGHFPPRLPDRNRDELTFVLGNDPPSGWPRSHHARGHALSVRLADVEELAELKGRAVVMDDWLRARLSSQVAVVLLDATRLPTDPKALLALPNHAFRRFDAALASCLGLLQVYLKADRARHRALLQPVFVLTKMDLLGVEARAAWGAIPPLAARGRPARSPWLQSLLAGRMPQTNGLLSENGAGIRFAPPVCYLSSVRTEVGEGGEVRVRRRLRLPEGGYEPDYPYEEFAALIEFLQRFADPADAWAA